MKKLSKEKRNQLVLVVLVTLIVLAGLWYGLINLQKEGLDQVEQRITAAQHKMKLVEQAVRRSDKIEADLNEANQKLAVIEQNMASGDLYSWVYNNVRQFKLPYKIEIPAFSQPVVGDVDLLPRFPYKQVTITVN